MDANFATSSADSITGNNTMYAVVVTAPNGCNGYRFSLSNSKSFTHGAQGPTENICENQVISFSASGGVSPWYPIRRHLLPPLWLIRQLLLPILLKWTDINGCKANGHNDCYRIPRPIVNLTDTLFVLAMQTLDAGNAGSNFSMDSKW